MLHLHVWFITDVDSTGYWGVFVYVETQGKRHQLMSASNPPHSATNAVNRDKQTHSANRTDPYTGPVEGGDPFPDHSLIRKPGHADLNRVLGLGMPNHFRLGGITELNLDARVIVLNLTRLLQYNPVNVNRIQSW